MKPMISRKDMIEAWELYSRAMADLGYVRKHLYCYENDNRTGEQWTHIPFKDASMNCSGHFSYALEPENWDIPEEKIEKIQRCMDEIYEFARKMCRLFPKGTYIPAKLVITPKYLFPWYNPGSMAWRMGLGESYSEWFYEKYRSLSEKNKALVNEWYPIPKVYSYRRNACWR